MTSVVFLSHMARENATSGQGALLRKARKEQRLTQTEAAARARISTARASELERCQEMPWSQSADRYAESLGFRIERLTRLVRRAA
jgi:transcriptional regulator with XRE-family HTH domain